MNIKDQGKTLSDNELEQFILVRLKRRDSLNQITTLVCEMLSCDWYAGGQLVKQVQDKHKNELTRRTHRLSIPIGIMSIVLGIVIILFASLWLKPFVYLFNTIQAGETINVGTARALLYLVTSPQTPRTFYLVAIITLTALGMILGGIVGIVQAVWLLWKLHD